MGQRIYATVSEKLFDWLVNEAQTNGRTLSNQIAWLLNQAREGQL
jgi:CopG-like RHH_1 or ribbon-helix-helix domain, RHH_5